MKIMVDDLSGPRIKALLTEHLDEMRATSPPESKHALDLDDLRRPGVTFWSAYDGEEVIGCGAIKQLDATHAEVKSMRTARSHQGGGVASTLLAFMIDEARRMGFRRVSLETGSAEFFAPARRLYRKFGFAECEPFGDYRPDPHSVFLTREL